MGEAVPMRQQLALRVARPMSEQQAEQAPSTSAVQPTSSADVAMVVSTTTVSAHFKMIFLAVLGLTVITLVARRGLIDGSGHSRCASKETAVSSHMLLAALQEPWRR